MPGCRGRAARAAAGPGGTAATPEPRPRRTPPPARRAWPPRSRGMPGCRGRAVLLAAWSARSETLRHDRSENVTQHRQRLRSAAVGSHEVVLLHGQPGSGSDWRQLADLLPGDLRLLALDRPGYGASRVAAGGFAFNARAVLAEMDARSIERAVLVGHSYGGGVALSLATLAPERVEALVLMASVGPGCLTGWDRPRGRARGLVADSVAGPRPAGWHRQAASAAHRRK